MAVMPQQGLLAISLFQAAAISILLLLYFLLYRGFPRRHFRTDLKMPGEITVRLLYQRIGRQRPELASRVVFTLSDAASEEIRTLLEQTGAPFVQKPFRVESFLRAVQQAV